MQNLFNAIFPVFVLLLLGNLARRTGFLNDGFWEQAEKATYYVLFPALLVNRLANTPLEWHNMGGLMLGAVLLPLLAAVLSLPFKGFLQLNGADFTSFFQGAVRFNSYVALAMAAVLPVPALTLAALVLALMIPVVNVLCVLVFAAFTGSSLKMSRILLTLARNPLILACLLGILLNLAPFGLPGLLESVLGKLGQMALPLGLLAVGAGLRLKALHADSLPFLWVSLFKLCLLPLVAAALVRILELDSLAGAVLIMFAALPTASSAYILARQLGGNATLMAGIITGQTLFSLLTLPLVLWLISR